MKSTKQITVSWLILVGLTLLSVMVGDFVHQPSLFIVAALFLVFLKGQQIVDVFMELKHAPRFWRTIFLSYVLLIPAVVSVIYIL